MAGKQSFRLLARQLRAPSQQCTRRSITTSQARLAAHNFTMPAMSPTMTEGNIASWKVQEGDSFEAGDILLEIETDKASMDVEAQDDGKMAKIFSPDGSKSVKVGTRIAVLADPDDDVSSLEIPADDSKPVQSAADNVKGGQDASYESSGAEKDVKGTPQNKRPSRDRPQTSPRGPGQNPKYPLYPSVIALIHENHIPDAEVSKIPATGPNNRLLKGDVLAYLGDIKADYSSEQSKRIQHLAHLDLSNIKILEQKPKSAPTAAAPEADTPKLTAISLPISLAEVLKVQKRVHDTLGVSMPLSTFLARAVDIANDDLPIPKGTPPSSNDLFNAVLGLNAIPTRSRGTYLPQIDALPPSSLRAQPIRKAVQPDIIDVLTGNTTSARPRRPVMAPTLTSPIGGSITTSGGAVNVFSLLVPLGEEKRARTFLERMKSILQVEPGRLVL
jgi:biotin carboxyl carrier protein